MAVLYSATLFVSAFLLFAIQPMAGKALLPWLGGAPDVWNACMFFFQGVLLLGYLYAHALSRFASRRAQPFLHLAVLATATTVVLLVRPHAPDDAAQISTRPVFWILKSLAAWVGIPYFTLAATSPLLQKWFSSSRHRRAADPYFLYSASNWGSLAALLSYPLAVEPWLGLSSQRNVWAAGYVVLAFLLAAIAVSLARSRERFEARPRAARPARPARIAAWIGLAFLPSSLLLGATTYLSTDIAPIPLLWVVPLAIYLLTFIYAIEVSPRLLGKLRHACALLALMIVLTILKPSAYPVWLVVALHLALLGTAALLCHATLMRRRPHVGDLTLFYLCISIGGVLGGLFNSVLAPRLFTSLAEYPIAILLVCAMRSAVPERGEKKPRWKPDLGFAALVGALGVGLGYATALVPGLPTIVHNVIVVGVPVVLCLRSISQPRRFALTLAAIYAGATLFPAGPRTTIFAARNFFGAIQVVRDTEKNGIALYHGRTLHGIQPLDPKLRNEPYSYYARSGPVGEVFMYLKHPARVGVIGLGTGTLLTYSEKGDRWTYYEINPQVVAVARNTAYFTYLAESRAPQVEVELGDARLKLAQAPLHGFDVLVLDAFGSDSIPIHLLTREAMQLYWSRLAEGGVLLLHISNNYLDLSRALGPLAKDAGAEAYVRDDLSLKNSGVARLATTWAVMARAPGRLSVVARDPRWRKLEGGGGRVWSDDYFNLLSLLRFR